MKKISIIILLVFIFANISCAWNWFGLTSNKSQNETDINLGGDHQKNKTQTGDINNGVQGNEIGKMVEQFAIALCLIIIAVTFSVGKFMPNKKQKLLQYKISVIENYINSCSNENIKKSELKDFINNI